MMPEITCPYCKEYQEVDGDKFPERACDTEIIECAACEKDVEVGWYAIFEAYKPEPPRDAPQ